MSFPTEKIFDKQIRRSFLRRLFRRVFLEDWLTKVIAVSITLTLWLGVTGLRSPKTVRFGSVPLTIRYSNDTEVTNSPAQEVELTVTGDIRKIDQINRNDLVVLLDLTDIPAGDRKVSLAPETVNIDLPTGVKLESVQPNQIAVKLEAVEEREIPVRIETEGALPENLEIYSQTVAPAKVRVRGPKSFVESLDSVSTEKINLDNRQTDFAVRQAELNLVNPKVVPLDTIVDVFFKIGEKRIERIFSVPFQIDGKTQTATIILYGARSIIEAVETENLRTGNFTVEACENSAQIILPVELQDKTQVRSCKLKVNK